MNDRPILIQLQQILKKPMVQIGDIPAQGKNKLRNHILREAEQSGADAVKFQGIKDNKTSNQNVTFIFDPITSTIIPPKETRAFKEQMTKLTPQQIRQEANEGVRDIMMWYKSPQWETRAASRGLTQDEIKAFQNLQGRVLSQKLPMSDRFGPVNVMVEDMGKGVQGYSQFLPKSIHTNQYPSEHFIAISNQAQHPYYTAIHEGMHHGTFNIGSTGWATPQITLSPIEQNALDKVLRNAKALNDRLEIDPNKFTTLMNKLQTKYGMSEADARHWIGNRVKYWQTPQESRARAGAVNQYKRNHPNASEEELTQIDNARQIFTNESLNNLYGKLQHQESQWHWLPVSQKMENDFSSLIKDNTYLFDYIKIIFAHNNYYSEKVIRNNFKQALTLFKVCPCLMPSQYACFLKMTKKQHDVLQIGLIKM